MPFDARVVVNSSLLVHSSIHVEVFVFCRAKIAPLGGNYTPISQETWNIVPGPGTAQIPISAAVDVGPGTYDVQAACHYFGDDAPNFFRGDLTAVAIAR